MAFDPAVSLGPLRPRVFMADPVRGKGFVEDAGPVAGPLSVTFPLAAAAAQNLVSAALGDPAKLLDIHVDQVTGALVLITADTGPWPGPVTGVHPAPNGRAPGAPSRGVGRACMRPGPGPAAGSPAAR